MFVGIFCATSLFTATSCIDETSPTSGATEEQVKSSSKGTEALVWAMPAFMNDYGTVAGNHYEFGYGAIMHVRDVMTGDLVVVDTSYDWFGTWAKNKNQGENSALTQFIWNFYTQLLQKSNMALKSINEKGKLLDAEVGMRGAAYAYRAMTNLDMAQMYEFLPNDKTEGITSAGNDVTNYTIPIIRENMTEAEARKNPRVKREEIAKFILEDLDKAEKDIVNLENSDKELPHLDAVYGLKARFYMWLGNYEEAKKYARLAIDNCTGSIMNEDDCLSTNNGFNKPDKWMWAASTIKENDVVQTGIINWTSWMTPEASYGYSAAGATSMIDASMYDRMSNTDFRKRMYKAPEGHPLETKINYLDAEAAAGYAEYAAIKFRPGGGNTADYSIGSSVSYPLMRVEEMYFIEAEAAERLAAGSGVELLTQFMLLNRDDYYTMNADDAIDEILFQKRVELWGEGHTFFDIKRADLSVLRGYEGTNFGATKTFNTTGRPAWMNICFVITEKNNNSAFIGWENPDPTDVYTPWTGK